MKILITESFEKREFRFLVKHFSLGDFCKKLKEAPPILLKHPYFKIKFHVKWIALRGVVLVTKWDNLIPLLTSLKKERDGENILWETDKKDILFAQEIALKDIQDGKFKEF